MPHRVMAEAAAIDDGGTNLAVQCLAIIAKHHGLKVDPEHLKGVSKQGPLDTRVLKKVALKLGLRCKAERFNWSQLVEADQLPAIVRFNDGSSMVLRAIQYEGKVPRLILEDPVAGPNQLLVIDQFRFLGVWSGHVILVSRNTTLLDETQPFSWGLVVALVMRERKMFRDVALCACTMSFISLAPALFAKLLMTRVLDYRNVTTFVVLCCAFAVLILFETALGGLRRYILSRLVTRIDIKLSTYVFNKVLNLPVDYFESTPLGITMHRLSQLNDIRRFLIGQLFGTVLDLSLLFFFIPVMFIMSPVLTGIVVLVCALIFAWILALLPLHRKRASAVVAAEAARGAFASQTIAGIRTVKTLALDARQRHVWADLTAKIVPLRYAAADVESLVHSVTTIFERLMVSGAIAVGVYIILKSDTQSSSIGTLFAFYLLAQRVAAPLHQIATLISQFDEARLAVNVVAGLVNQPEEEGRSGHGLRLPIRGHVEFCSVEFKYRGALQPALRAVSFDVPAGTTLGVMGRSGSGKTTLTRLLQRLHSDYRGVLKIDGIDVREFDVDHLRSSLGVVLQENFLFSGTIRENITAAKIDATFEEMVAAARLAGAEEFIDKLPRGYETMIYEGSQNLSGGQRQRLAIARALITNPRILILDEATSALDAESEAIVNANLRRIAQGRTMIVISHRLSSLVNADAILVLDQGEVQDIGTHQELLDRNDIYSGLWYRQNAHAEDAAA